MSSPISKCPKCDFNAFGLDDKGHFCYNCGDEITQPLNEGVPVFDHRLPEPIQEVGGEESRPTIPLRLPQESRNSEMKTVPRRKVVKKKAPANKAANKRGSTKAKTTKKKSPVVKKEGPKEGTAAYYALHGKKDGEPVSRGENAVGGEKGYLNNLLIKNLQHQQNGSWKRMLSNEQLAQKFMDKFPGKNFQAMSNYISYFNRAHGGQGCNKKFVNDKETNLMRAGTDDALRPKAYWERQAAKQK